MKNLKTFINSVATVSSLTFVSRISGFLRDALIAAFLGAGIKTDAFLIALQFPNLFRRLFAEGAFSAGFVPMFSEMVEGYGSERAKRFAEDVFSVLVYALLFFVIFMMMIMPIALLGIAPGFSRISGQLEYATELARITFPYLFFISLVSLQSGVLNAFGRFAAAAATPIIFNIILISSLLVAFSLGTAVAKTLAWGVLFAGVFQFLWLFTHMYSLGMNLKIRYPKLNTEVRILLKKILPVAFGAGLYQINLIVDKIIATLVSAGAVSWLYFADRVNQLPIGVFGVAIGVVLLPTLSKNIQTGKIQEAIYIQNRSIEIGLMLTIPASIGLIVLAGPIISVLYERGEFTANDRQSVAFALVAFSSGLPAYVLIKTFAPGFFSRNDTITPVKISAFCMVINIFLNLILMGPLGHVGIALATSISAWINVIFMGYFLFRRKQLEPDLRLIKQLPKIIISAVLMGFAVWLLFDLIILNYISFINITNFYKEGFLMKSLFLILMITLGFIFYTTMLFISSGLRIDDLKNITGNK